MIEKQLTNGGIHSFVSGFINNFRQGEITKSKHVTFNILDDIEKIDAYSNAKHTTGDKDSLGRDKVFFDIVTSAINTWYRATDIDRKNIKVRANKQQDYLKSIILKILLRRWMRKDNFGIFLNKWGRSLAKYNDSIIKVVERDNELVLNVVSWNNFVFDAVNFDSSAKIEVLTFTPEDLLRNDNYDKEVARDLIKSLTIRETIDGEQKDRMPSYVTVYEIHGSLPKSFLTDNEEDRDEYVQQMHVIAMNKGKDSNNNEFTLFRGAEKRDPYRRTYLLEDEDDMILLKGCVKYMFESIWMVNHTAKQIKDSLDLSTKILFQGADEQFLNRNVLTSLETGDFLIHEEGKPLTLLNNSGHDLTQAMNFQSIWKSLGNEIVGVSSSMLGETPKSGTAWRQTEALLQENHDLFEVMTENKGLHLERLIKEDVLPFLVKKTLNNRDEIYEILDDNDLKEIDSRYIKLEASKLAKKELKEMFIKGELPLNIDLTQSEEEIRRQLEEQGNRRSLVLSDVTKQQWRDYLDFDYDVEVDVTGESQSYREYLSTWATVLNTLGNNPQVLQTKEGKLVLNKILEATDALSPVELGTTPTNNTAPQTNSPINIEEVVAQTPA